MDYVLPIDGLQVYILPMAFQADWPFAHVWVTAMALRVLKLKGHHGQSGLDPWPTTLASSCRYVCL